MIRRILTYYAERLEEFLARTRRQPEGLAAVGRIGGAGDEPQGKVVVSLVNLEKEASGDTVAYHPCGGGYAGRTAPLLLNLYVMLAAVYEAERYGEALSLLSETLSFIHSAPSFTIDGNRYTVEVVPMSATDLHNIWTTMGGQYHPSVICKFRGLVLGSGGIVSGSSTTGETRINE